MKKLLLAAGDRELSRATIDFACYIAKLTKSGLTGIFLETPAHEEETATTLQQELGYVDSGLNTQHIDNEVVYEPALRQIARFKEACAAREIIGIPHGKHSILWKELISETRFVDALIMDSDFSMEANILEPYPSHFAKKLLHEAKCPVIISPLSFDGLNEIILTYDGSKSSLFAIRQFAYLFPELRETKVTILQVVFEHNELPREQEHLNEWLKYHFSHVESVTLEGDPESRLMEYLLSHPQSFVVMGGFGRSRISRLMQPSTSGKLVRLISSPVFMAHS